MLAFSLSRLVFPSRIRPAALAALLLSSGLAAAQTAADLQRAQQEAQRIQQQEQQRLEREREEALRSRPPAPGLDPRSIKPEISAPALGAGCRDIREIDLRGASRLDAETRARLLAPFLDRCLDVGDIERLLSDITRHYIDRGFVTTRAYIPQQDLSKGRLEILVIEGVVEKILIRDGERESVSVGNAFPGVEGGVLNLRDIEQGLDQVNRLASNNATLQILPGARIGGSIIAIDNAPKPRPRLFLSHDNQGSEGTGRRQTGATLSLDNPFGFDDFVSFTHRQSTPGDTQRKYSQLDSFSYVLPYGYNTFSLGISRSRYVSTLAMPSGLDLRAEGDVENDTVRAERLVYRDRSSRVTLAAGLTSKRARNFLAEQLLMVSSFNLTVLDLDANWTTGLAGGIVGLDLGWAQGLDTLDALSDLPGIPDAFPHAQFRKLKLGLSYHRPLRLGPWDGAWSSVLVGQRARDVLYGSEQVLIGGLYTVRGFERSTLSGDNGYYWRNDLSVRVPLRVLAQDLSLRPFVAYDQGRVTQNTPGAPEGRLSGAALGFSLSAGRANWELFASRPLTLPAGMVREGTATYFRLNLSL